MDELNTRGNYWVIFLNWRVVCNGCFAIPFLLFGNGYEYLLRDLESWIVNNIFLCLQETPLSIFSLMFCFIL
jgi:hypothetical protein